MLIGEGYRTFPVVLYTEFINEVGGNDGFVARDCGDRHRRHDRGLPGAEIRIQ